LFTAAVCRAEILSGTAVLPIGRRRADLEEAARAMFAGDLHERVLPFDAEATAYAEVFAANRRAGRTVDLMLAAIARVRRARSATSPSEPVGLTVISSWKG